MMDELVIIKFRLNKLADNLTNYEGEDLADIREALQFVVMANQCLATAKTLLSNIND